jgi:pSer/pThr/pTyr-binding forkhead associated (FHA) protein
MILRRLVIFMIIVFLVIVTGIYFIYSISEETGMSRSLTDLFIVLFIGLTLITSLVLGKNIPREGSGIDVELPPAGRKKTQKSYAWLVPQTPTTQAGFPVTKKFMIIGRDINVDITINHPSVSKKHAQLTSFDNQYLLKDLDSRNGTFINNQRIQESYLGEGDIITFGEAKFILSFPREKSVVHEEESELSPSEIDLDLSINLEDLESGILTSTRTNTRKGSRLRDLSGRKKRFLDKKLKIQKTEETFCAGKTSPEPGKAESGKLETDDKATQISRKPETGTNKDSGKTTEN